MPTRYLRYIYPYRLLIGRLPTTFQQPVEGRAVRFDFDEGIIMNRPSRTRTTSRNGVHSPIPLPRSTSSPPPLLYPPSWWPTGSRRSRRSPSAWASTRSTTSVRWTPTTPRRSSTWLWRATSPKRTTRRASDAHATVHTLPLPHLAPLDLTIDVAVIKGEADSVLLHLSGTHGVEGFAGSAIQSAILQQAGNLTTSKRGPTVVLVHAVNPYGFSQLCRVNENNVDLNRNSLPPEEFAEATAADPNQNGYNDFYDVSNPLPSGAPWRMHLAFVKSIPVAVASKGWAALKKAMVSATYHYPEGIVFDGTEKQPSLQVLEAFLNDQIRVDTVETLAVVDIHTGLGPSGVDTIILSPSCNRASAEKIFATESAADLVSSSKGGVDNAVTKGYSATRGLVADGIAQLVSPDHRSKVVTIAQEFGTVPAVFMMKALVEENAFYQHAPTRRLPLAEKLRDVFYVHESPSWKKSIVDRGLAVFQKLYAHTSKH